MERLDLSIVIPAYNEEKRISNCITRVGELFLKTAISFEIIVVDDGSSDSTPLLVEGHGRGVRLISYRPNRGKGYAVKRGFLEAVGGMVLMTDSDLSTPLEDFYRLAPFIEEGYHIVIGSRALPGSRIDRSQPLMRVLAGRAYNTLLRAAGLTEFSDTQCGFKLFAREPCRRVFERTRVEGFGFDIEVLYLAEKAGLRIKEVPVSWSDSEETRVRFLPDSLVMFRDSLLVKLWDMAGLYRD